MLYIGPREGILTRVMSKIFSVNLWPPHICTYTYKHTCTLHTYPTKSETGNFRSLRKAGVNINYSYRTKKGNKQIREDARNSSEAHLVHRSPDQEGKNFYGTAAEP